MNTILICIGLLATILFAKILFEFRPWKFSYEDGTRICKECGQQKVMIPDDNGKMSWVNIPWTLAPDCNCHLYD